MQKWIALLRGVNVGGKNILPMKDLRALLEGLGHREVKTYIQSGNCVFASAVTNRTALQAGLAAAIEKSFGFRPAVLVLTAEDMKAAIDRNPFGERVNDPKNLHLHFLIQEGTEACDLATLQDYATADEEFQLIDGVFYFYAPNGMGRSKAADKITRFLPVEMTARNLNSARKILDLAT